MKRYLYLFILVSVLFVMPKSVYAYSVSNYENRNLCNNFEVAAFKADGSITTKKCTSNYNEAKEYMKNDGSEELAIMAKVSGKVKIVDANVALLDLSVNPETLTYFYTNSDLKGSSYTYMDTGSLYGGVDGVHMDSALNSKGVWVAKVRIGNFTGWISEKTYEIVPIQWVKSTSSYTVTNDSIRHNYVAKIQNTYSGSAGSTIGPKPTMLATGKYYSYDGHYFYTDLRKLIKDYKNGNYNNSVNKNNKYYNYYMYLSNHTRTTYSSINIDEYIRNSLGIKMDVYGNDDDGSSSRLYGSGTFFYYAQEKYGVNAILSLSLSRNETGNGRSDLAINKNNGFGLNAVDSNPSEEADWYASFASSILGYADKWITRGYAYPKDWRYFGPQFGDKWIGMNVKYASDTYWSEKMAANYYSLDRAKGLQDYNYYQLAVAKGPLKAYADASTNSKFIYEYPEAEDAMVIVGEKNGWYEVVSDLNIDNNNNEINGNYNWNKTVYVQKSGVTLINSGKNGFISPNSVTEYQDSDYTYDLMVQDTTFKPKVGISTKNTSFYYDPSLQSKNGETLVKNRNVMIYSIAYENGIPVSYLVTSHYRFCQKHWVSADSIQITNKAYGVTKVTVSGNQYTWINSTTQDTADTLISGLYTNSYVPILEERIVNGQKWYKVPVDINGNKNEFGWTLASAPGVSIRLVGTINNNNFPVINASNKEIVQGTNIDVLKDVTASDVEDGNITKKIKVRSNNLNINTPGKYQVTYEVTDSSNLTTTKTITIVVKVNEKPVINASDIEMLINTELKQNVTATDKEDGNITNKIKTTKNTVNTKVAGVYEITYEVTDSYNQKTTKTIKVTVLKNQNPVINASNKEIVVGSEFKELDGVTATDKEDGNITNKIKVIENTVNTNSKGTYKVTYEVIDSANNKTTKTIEVKVITEEEQADKAQLVDGNFYFNYLKTENNKLKLQGYQTIIGINNDLKTNITYQIIFENINNGKETIIKGERITGIVPKKVYSPDGYDYTYSWFNATIDIDTLEIGNYKMYVVARTNNKYSKSLVANKSFNQQTTYVKAKNNALISNNYSTSKSFVEIKVREQVLVEKTSSYVYNQYDKYTKFEFTNDNKLHLRGNTYSYGMDLNSNAKVERKLIFENISTYKTYTKDLGSITNGNYKVVLPENDNLDKTRAWYDNNIDLSDIEEGTYVIYIATKSNISDINEFTEKLGRSLDNVSKTINNKKYSFTINKDRGNRIEMTVTR